MDAKIENMLKKKEHPENIQRLLDDIKSMLCYSRGKMSSRYKAWDRNKEIFEGKRAPDKDDYEAVADGEPEKMIVPTTYTQVMTFVTFAFQLYRQGPTMFELAPTGNEDYDLETPGSSMIERDLRWNQFSTKLFQILVDIGRFGLCATKTVWTEEYQSILMALPSEPSEFAQFSFTKAPIEQSVDVLKFEGCKIVNISPYRLIPDMRLPLTRWKEGRFVADEQEYHSSYFKNLESRGIVVGTEYIQPMIQEDFKASKRYVGEFDQIETGFAKQNGNSGDTKDEKDFMCVSTDIHIRLKPKKYDLEDVNEEVDYLITIANDNRILRIERANYAHGDFIYDIAQFSPDEHLSLSLAISDTISALQDVVTWLINARIIALRQGLDRHLIVDPVGIDTSGLTNRSPIIYKRKGSPQMPLANFIQQIKYTDTSSQNMGEAESLMRIMQLVTGVNENAMGQYSPGRRSASENQAANRGAASRMTLHATLIWEQLLAPLARKVLLTHRQSTSFETFKKVIGQTSPESRLTIEQLYEQFVPADPRELIGNEDFLVFDTSGQSEKQYQAQALQELTQALIASPEVMMMTEYDLTKLIDGIQQLRGIKNVNRYKTPRAPIAPGPVADEIGGSIAGEPEIGADSVPNEQVV